MAAHAADDSGDERVIHTMPTFKTTGQSMLVNEGSTIKLPCIVNRLGNTPSSSYADLLNFSFQTCTFLIDTLRRRPRRRVSHSRICSVHSSSSSSSIPKLLGLLLFLGGRRTRVHLCITPSNEWVTHELSSVLFHDSFATWTTHVSLCNSDTSQIIIFK